jgi:hypothetical protein
MRAPIHVNLVLANELKISLMQKGCSVQRVVAVPTAPLSFSKDVQLRVHYIEEGIDGVSVPLPHAMKKLSDSCSRRSIHGVGSKQLKWQRRPELHMDHASQTANCVTRFQSARRSKIIVGISLQRRSNPLMGMETIEGNQAAFNNT